MTQAQCILFPGSLDTHGYGRVKVNGKSFGAHRLAYIEQYGDIPTGLQVDHLCRNRSCVNPSHLELITQKENILRGHSFAGLNKSKTHCSKGHELTTENVKLTKRGQRDCIKCRKLHEKKIAEKRKEQRARGGDND